MKQAIKIIDGLQDRYRPNLQAAIASGDNVKIAHWHSFMSALTIAAMELEKVGRKMKAA